MNIVKAVLRRIRHIVHGVREWSSGDDLHEAQSHRSDDHQNRANPGPMI